MVEQVLFAITYLSISRNRKRAVLQLFGRQMRQNIGRYRAMSVLEVNEIRLLPSPPTDTFPLITSRVKNLHHSQLDTGGDIHGNERLTGPKRCQHMVQCK